MVRIIELPNAGGDARGDSFTLPRDAFEFLGEVKDIHIATVVPGAVRGDHFHLRRREVVIVHSDGEWAFHWDGGAGTAVERRTFHVRGTTAILIEPGHAHAVQNTGHSPLLICGLSSEPYDPGESVVRAISKATERFR